MNEGDMILRRQPPLADAPTMWTCTKHEKEHNQARANEHYTLHARGLPTAGCNFTGAEIACPVCGYLNA